MNRLLITIYEYRRSPIIVLEKNIIINVFLELNYSIKQEREVMVSGVNSTSAYQYQSQVDSTTTLTDDQKKTLESILSKYDPSNMTQDSTKSLMDELKNSGIKPSKTVRDIMDAAGFKPPEKPQGGTPPDDSTSSTDSTSGASTLPQYMLDFITKEESGNVTKDDIATLIQNLQSAGKTSSGTLVDQTV